MDWSGEAVLTGPSFRLRLDEPTGLWCVVRVEDGVALQACPWSDKATAVKLRYRLVIDEEARQRAKLKAVAAIGPMRYILRRPAPLPHR